MPGQSRLIIHRPHFHRRVDFEQEDAEGITGGISKPTVIHFK